MKEQYLHIKVKNGSVLTSAKGITPEEVVQGIYGFCQVLAKEQEVDVMQVQIAVARMLLSVKENG